MTGNAAQVTLPCKGAPYVSGVLLLLTILAFGCTVEVVIHITPEPTPTVNSSEHTNAPIPTPEATPTKKPTSTPSPVPEPTATPTETKRLEQEGGGLARTERDLRDYVAERHPSTEPYCVQRIQVSAVACLVLDDEQLQTGFYSVNTYTDIEVTMLISTFSLDESIWEGCINGECEYVTGPHDDVYDNFYAVMLDQWPDLMALASEDRYTVAVLPLAPIPTSTVGAPTEPTSEPTSTPIVEPTHAPASIPEATSTKTPAATAVPNIADRASQVEAYIQTSMSNYFPDMERYCAMREIEAACVGISDTDGRMVLIVSHGETRLTGVVLVTPLEGGQARLDSCVGTTESECTVEETTLEEAFWGFSLMVAENWPELYEALD